MHSFIRSLIHRTSSGAPFTCPLHMPSAVRASGRSPEHGRKPPPRGGPALPFTSPENSFLSRQWGRVVTGSLRCKDAMRQRRRGGRGARGHPPPHAPCRQNHRFVHALAHSGTPAGLAGWGSWHPCILLSGQVAAFLHRTPTRSCPPSSPAWLRPFPCLPEQALAPSGPCPAPSFPLRAPLHTGGNAS